MAPSAKKLEQALVDGTREVWIEEPDNVTVNKVRKHVEEKLDLEDGFFSAGQWKNRSKTVIKEHVVKLLEEADLTPKKKSGPKKAIARKPAGSESPKQKRNQRPTKQKAPKTEDSDASEAEGKVEDVKTAKSDDGEPALKSSASPPLKRKRNLKEEDDLDIDQKDKKSIKIQKEDDQAVEDAILKKQADESDDQESSELKKDEEADSKPSTKDEKIDSKPSIKDEDAKNAIPEEDEEEYSDVIDEVPTRRKTKKEQKKEPASKDAKSKKSKGTVKKASSLDDPQEAEVKKLQSQLVKCGIRKLWHNELKEHGNDTKAKIRHLRRMLADIGMDGRFSEAKAKEIRETRELLADAEAAQEMNRLWGSGSGGRASRSKAKTRKFEESEDSGDEAKAEAKADGSEDEEEQEETTFAARRKRAQADLAFLGDDSDSD
ncbi:hypothetical protein S40288_01900 [Stachybotrys chartarum IBT 40288]|nr:hypothetical protein S40288_01900 [Stachybotrys chartarum IBT 40288]